MTKSPHNCWNNFKSSCFTYQLDSYHENCFKGKCSVTQIKQIFQTRSQQFQHHSIVFTTRAKIVNLRYTIWGKREKRILVISSSSTSNFISYKFNKQFFKFFSFKNCSSSFTFPIHTINFHRPSLLLLNSVAWLHFYCSYVTKLYY